MLTKKSDFPSAIDCGYPGYIEDGYVEGRSFLFGDVVKYSCRRGFRMEGRAERRCGRKGVWEGEEPSCKRKWLSYRMEKHANMLYRITSLYL